MDVETTTSRQLSGGTLQVFVAEALVVPTGFLTAAFLTRRLGPDGYGLLALASTLIAWLEWSLASILARTVTKFVAEADDWRPVATTSLRAHFLIGAGLGLAVWLFAPAVARWLNEPALVGYLRLFALDLPLFGLAHAHRHVLVGRGDYGPRALATGSRWIVRLLVVLVLVQAGLSVEGAIIGSLAGSVAELALARRRARIPWRRAAVRFPAQQLWGFALPIVLMALSLRLFDKIDLFMLKALGATAAQAGLYGAAQNLAWLPGIFALAYTPLLIATLSRLRRQGADQEAGLVARQALRLVLLLVPPAALVVGSAPELMRLAYGAPFAPAALVLGPLLAGGLALVLVSVTTAILTAGGKPNITFALTGPLVPLAVVGVWLVAPRGGLLGAALVTGLLACASAGVSLLAVRRLWGIWPPPATVARCLALAVLAFGLGALWPTPGLWWLLKLAVGSLGLGLALAVSGEVTPAEARWLWQWLQSLRGWPWPPRVAPARSDG